GGAAAVRGRGRRVRVRPGGGPVHRRGERVPAAGAGRTAHGAGGPSVVRGVDRVGLREVTRLGTSRPIREGRPPTRARTRPGAERAIPAAPRPDGRTARRSSQGRLEPSCSGWGPWPRGTYGGGTTPGIRGA